jgi:hypothetical protein
VTTSATGLVVAGAGLALGLGVGVTVLLIGLVLALAVTQHVVATARSATDGLRAS